MLLGPSFLRWLVSLSLSLCACAHASVFPTSPTTSNVQKTIRKKGIKSLKKKEAICKKDTSRSQATSQLNMSFITVCLELYDQYKSRNPPKKKKVFYTNRKMDQCKETSRKIKLIHSFKIQDHKIQFIWSSTIIFSQQTKKAKKQKREGETTTHTTQSIDGQIIDCK